MSGVQIIGGEKLEEALQKLLATKAMHVRVGVLAGTYPDGTSIASVAEANEFGGPTNPARPFMRRTVAERSAVWKSGFAKLMETPVPELALGVLGEKMAADIQATIMTIAGEGGNAESTIERKRSKTDRPLIDSLLMHDSIKHEVVPGESE